MKTHRWVLLSILMMFLGALSPILGYPADPDRQALRNLLSDLEKKIEEADKRMVAHPKFLDELSALVKKYRAGLRRVFLSEDFSDGEYERNPTWVIDAGRFQINASRRLLSEVFSEKPAARPSKKEKPSPFGKILEEIVRSTLEEDKESGPTGVTQEARIHTLAKIGAPFEVDLTLVSESTWGSMEVVLLGGNPPVPWYRMVYHPAPSADRPIEIIREREARSFLIETATHYPSLDDGAPHRLQWIRDSEGRMQVLVDGQSVLTTVELFYQKAFAGLALVNRGGTYEWGPIRVFRAQKGKP
jgi:hypothetical protein